MVLEAVMLCVDNSAYSRNGDYLPTRLKAQTEAVAELAHAKMNSNPETSVGFLSMAGGRIEVRTLLLGA
jgi:26S proteasome regulatory subunit N10